MRPIDDVPLEDILAAEKAVDAAIQKHINKEKYGWSKWGDGYHGLFKGKVPTEWYCQACGDAQPQDLPPYNFPISAREFVRICSSCQHTVTTQQIRVFTVLVSTVKADRF